MGEAGKNISTDNETCHIKYIVKKISKNFVDFYTKNYRHTIKIYDKINQR